MQTTKISEKNAVYWDELCGSNIAKVLGVTDSSTDSLKKFDDWYFEYYPYLFDHIPFAEMGNKKVLDIGLGYGTVAQRLAESGALYTGLDIAQGPVSMANHRLAQCHLPEKAVQGSILNPPFEPETFDYVTAIGCLHHTGNLQLAIDQCYRLLKPGGRLIFMVYYAYSYRRLLTSPILTLSYSLKELFGYHGVVGESSKKQSAAYDASAEGDLAPHTDWISARSLEHFCRAFSSFNATTENIAQERPFQKRSRVELLKTKWPSVVGLDIYATATK